MAKGVGLDAGEFEVKVVELDGSYRKPRLTKASLDRVDQRAVSSSDPDHAASEASALKHALKDAHIGKQNVCLGFPSREALFRRMQVPFTGAERIRKVIKFEAEGEIHSQSVDDMVIDFHVVEERNEETRVLVAGVPKAPLRTTLTALESVGIEPERVDLDCMGLYRVATWAGVFTAEISASGEAILDVDRDEDERVEGEEAMSAAIPVGAQSRVVVDVGARSTLVLVVTGGHLTDMRAIPLGCDSMAEELAAKYGSTLDQARDAIVHCLGTGEDLDVTDFVIEDDLESDPTVPDEASGDEVDPEESQVPARSVVIDAGAVELARDRFLQRLRRESVRFLVSLKSMGRVDGVFTTGGGSHLVGLDDVLADVYGCRPQPLLYMHLLQHSFDEEEAAYLESRLAVAVGLALGGMNGIKGFNFRQEDLVFTRGFDRIKLPLAIACMLTLFYLFFHGVGLRRELANKEYLFGQAMDKTAQGGQNRRVAGGAVTNYKQYSGRLSYLVNESFWPGRHLPHNEYRTMVNDMAEQPTFERVDWYLRYVQRLLREVQKKGQYEPSLALDSGVAVLEQFSGVIASVEEQITKFGPFYICDLDINLPEKGSGRNLTFKVFFRGSSFREQNVVLEDAFQSAFKDRDLPFEKFQKPATENPISGDVVGCYYDYYIDLRSDISVQKIKELP